MGEAKRRKETGVSVKQAAKEIVNALNKAAGGEAWFNVRESKTQHAPPSFVYHIANSRSDAVPVHVKDVEKRDECREVFVVLVRNGKPWLGTLVVDFTPEYRTEKYSELGRWASDIATAIFSGDGRIPSASLLIRSAWAKADATVVGKHPETWVPPKAGGA